MESLVYNPGNKWVQELRDESNIVTEIVCATLNLPDALTKCLAATAQTARLAQLDRLVNGLRRSYVRHLGDTTEASALPGMDKYIPHRRWWLRLAPLRNGAAHASGLSTARRAPALCALDAGPGDGYPHWQIGARLPSA